MVPVESKLSQTAARRSPEEPSVALRPVEGGITAPGGFRAGAAACGIKRQRPGAERPLAQ